MSNTLTDGQRDEVRALIREEVAAMIAEVVANPKLPTDETFKFLRDSALEVMTRRMPNHSNTTPTKSVYILYEAAAGLWACCFVNVPGAIEAVKKWVEADRLNPIRPPHDPKAYLPLTTQDGKSPHPDRFAGEDIDLDAPVPKGTWPCQVDADPEE